MFSFVRGFILTCSVLAIVGGTFAAIVITGDPAHVFEAIVAGFIIVCLVGAMLFQFISVIISSIQDERKLPPLRERPMPAHERDDLVKALPWYKRIIALSTAVALTCASEQAIQHHDVLSFAKPGNDTLKPFFFLAAFCALIFTVLLYTGLQEMKRPLEE